jgi:hypothetical protein
MNLALIPLKEKTPSFIFNQLDIDYSLLILLSGFVLIKEDIMASC